MTGVLLQFDHGIESVMAFQAVTKLALGFPPRKEPEQKSDCLIEYMQDLIFKISGRNGHTPSSAINL
jgi:hypothetical protein